MKVKKPKLIKGANRKAAFIRALAEFLTRDLAFRSIRLEMKDPIAVEWANLWGLTPLFGYPSAEEAEKVLTEFLS